jgi:hypothetical protein
VLTDEGDRLFCRYTVDDGEARQGGTGATPATTAGDLDPPGGGVLPCFAQDLPGLYRFAGQPEVAPA